MSSISVGESPRTRQTNTLISLDQADDFACKASKEEVVEEDNVVAAGVHGTTPMDNTDNQPVIEEHGGQGLQCHTKRHQTGLKSEDFYSR